ncbi:acetylxylan esterase precursor [Colletotrichum truncatum]|uniref:Acetylxylan esterase n=1 Tax=Colletotrichum truncatum TaxID=5467 RepID=A0ACC3ZK81_COLTU|nr:acetylxylan esterase precursor [Colletotrichum truncatum]KAF6799912.1 acetylxylan esterase precursor [Colletotrichum truncatum]
MVPNLSTALVALSALSWTSGASVVTRQATGASECRDVHIFLARGNNEPYPGRQGKLVTAICDGLDSCDYEDIQFWNPLEAPYCQSVEEGAANGTAQVTAYNKRCPNSKLVLSGYSQGGHVIGDVLGGGGGRFFQDCLQKSNPGLDATKAPGNKIAAALIFGDVRHTQNQPYNYLSGSGAQGLFPRPEEQLAGMRAYSKVMRSYCVDSDPICAGGDISANHLNYFDIYSGDAGKWVQQMVGNAETTTSSKAASTSTSASTMRTSTLASSSASVTATSASSVSSATGASTTVAITTGGAPSTGASTPASPTSDVPGSSATPAAPNNTAGNLACNFMLLAFTFVAVVIAV